MVEPVGVHGAVQLNLVLVRLAAETEIWRSVGAEMCSSGGSVTSGERTSVAKVSLWFEGLQNVWAIRQIVAPPQEKRVCWRRNSGVWSSYVCKPQAVVGSQRLGRDWQPSVLVDRFPKLWCHGRKWNRDTILVRTGRVTKPNSCEAVSRAIGLPLLSTRFHPRSDRPAASIVLSLYTAADGVKELPGLATLIGSP